MLVMNLTSMSAVAGPSSMSQQKECVAMTFGLHPLMTLVAAIRLMIQVQKTAAVVQFILQMLTNVVVQH